MSRSPLTKKRRRLAALDIIMLIAGLIYVSPVLLAILNSLKSLPEIIASPLALPKSFDLSNYAYIFSGLKIAIPMWNTLLLCVAVIVCLVAVAPMAAYSIVRRRMTTGNYWRIFFLAGLAIPGQVTMVPLLRLFTMLHIQLTYFSLFLVHVASGLPLAIFIYSAFISTIPKELEEAATIDGCGAMATFWRIIFPLLAPCTITIIIFWGLWIWNDFMTATIYMGPEKAQLVFVQLNKFLNDKYVKNWNYIFAGVVLLSAPVTLLYIAMQRRFIKGLTAGSYK